MVSSPSPWDPYVADFAKDYPDTELYVYFGPIRRPYDDDVIESFGKRAGKLRKNIVVMLSTLGGDPDAAYRICRCIQRHFGLLKKRNSNSEPGSNFAVYIDNVCASAGTLLATGTTELIMGDLGELSPIDIQIRKPDEASERDSGLTPTQALDLLERRSKSLFKQHFSQLRNDAEFALTTKTAVEFASAITTGLMSEIYGQIDPMRLGEVERMMGIMAAYGERLSKHNLKSGALAKLLTTYPSHSFVIDRCEAEDLFEKVSVPKPGLAAIGTWMRSLSDSQLGARRPIKFFATDPPESAVESMSALSEPPQREGEPTNGQEDTGGSGKGPSGPSPRPRAPRKRGPAPRKRPGG
jgi:hypothetical protein